MRLVEVIIIFQEIDPNMTSLLGVHPGENSKRKLKGPPLSRSMSRPTAAYYVYVKQKMVVAIFRLQSLVVPMCPSDIRQQKGRCSSLLPSAKYNRSNEEQWLLKNFSDSSALPRKLEIGVGSRGMQ